MHSKAKPPTKAERERFAKLKEFGCICCFEMGLGWRLPDIHHIISGGRRMGHRYTIPLCKWHHEGHRPDGWAERNTVEVFGPSLKSKRRFIEYFGSELELLDRCDAINGFESIIEGD